MFWVLYFFFVIFDVELILWGLTYAQSILWEMEFYFNVTRLSLSPDK